MAPSESVGKKNILKLVPLIKLRQLHTSFTRIIKNSSDVQLKVANSLAVS